METHFDIKQKIAAMIAANAGKYYLTDPRVVIKHANETLHPIVRQKRVLNTTHLSAIPNYIKNIINQIFDYVRHHMRYPTTQVRNIFAAREMYKKLNKSQKMHFNKLPEWETYLKLLDYYESNRIMYKDRDYSLNLLRRFRERGPDLFIL